MKPGHQNVTVCLSTFLLRAQVRTIPILYAEEQQAHICHHISWAILVMLKIDALLNVSPNMLSPFKNVQ